MNIKQIVYSSQAVHVFDEPDLAALLDNAQSRNKMDSITGVLLHSPGRFMQCIEGPPQAIDGLYDRIKRDARHANLCILQDLPLSSTCFDQWSMGCAKISESDYLRISTAQWERVVDHQSDTGWLSPGFVLMRSIWHTYTGSDSR